MAKIYCVSTASKRPSRYVTANFMHCKTPPKLTVKHCLKNYGLSIMQSYSNITVEGLDNLVKSVKDRTPKDTR